MSVLHTFQQERTYEKDEEDIELEEIVFGPDEETNTAPTLDFFVDELGDHEPEEKDPENFKWIDHNEDVRVDLQSKNRLKKLRTSFSEETITGDEYEQRLRTQFQKINPTPSWAAVPDKDVAVDELFQTTGGFLDKSAIILNPEKVRMTRVADANQHEPSNCVVQTISFIPSAPVLLTAGLDKTLRLFHIDGKENPKLQSFYLKDLPIFSANFLAERNEVVLAGRRNFFYTLNLDTLKAQRVHKVRGRDEKSLEKSYISSCGNYIAIVGYSGFVLLLSTKTKQLVATVKMNNLVVSIAFTSDSMWTLSLDGDVCVWCLDSLSCKHRFKDDGCIKGTNLAVSYDGKLIAIGSSSGAVNLYTMDGVLRSSMPKPEKTILNLTTAVTTIAFHPTSKLMAIASKETKDSMKLYHIPSKKVVKNWPTSNTPLGYVSAVAFSPNGHYIAIGNDKGKILLYRFEDLAN